MLKGKLTTQLPREARSTTTQKFNTPPSTTAYAVLSNVTEASAVENSETCDAIIIVDSVKYVYYSQYSHTIIIFNAN